MKALPPVRPEGSGIAISLRTSIYAPKRKFLELFDADVTRRQKEEIWKIFKYKMSEEINSTWRQWIEYTIKKRKWWTNRSGKMFEDIMQHTAGQAEIRGGRLMLQFEGAIYPTSTRASRSWKSYYKNKELLDLLRSTNPKYYSDFIRMKSRVRYQEDIWDSNVEDWTNESVAMIRTGRDKRGRRAWIAKNRESRYLASKWVNANKGDQYKEKIQQDLEKLAEQWNKTGEDLFYLVAEETINEELGW